MARKKRQHRYCAHCHGLYWPDELRASLCPACRAEVGKQRRAKTGASLLERANESTVERDGRTYIVKTLPPTRRRRV